MYIHTPWPLTENRECSVLEKNKKKIKITRIPLLLSTFRTKLPYQVDVPSNLRWSRLRLTLGGHAWHTRIPKVQLPWAQTKSRNGSHTLLCSSLLKTYGAGRRSFYPSDSWCETPPPPIGAQMSPLGSIWPRYRITPYRDNTWYSWKWFIRH